MKEAYVHIFEQTDTEGRNFEQVIATTDKGGKGNMVKMYLGFVEPGLFSVESIKTIVREWNQYEKIGDHPTGFRFQVGDFVLQPQSLT